LPKRNQEFPLSLTRSDPGRGRAGFTLVELLVVIGIIVLLAGILLPMASRAYSKAVRAREALELQAIGAALENYKQDHGMYPDPGADPNVPSTTLGPLRGANTLCRALIAPGSAMVDGADGPGFRARPGGKIWNAYLPADQFKIGDRTGGGSIDFSTMTLDVYQQIFIIDRFKKPILYYRAQGQASNMRSANGFVALNPVGGMGARPLYDSSQNGWFLPQAGLRAMLGDVSNGTPITPYSAIQPNGMIDAGETPVFSGPYLLWSAGPDEKYGPLPEDAGNTSILEQVDVEKCDDVTNFRS
jgi:prepilin-type N-terminal cleavage/methylation domain-containing protein